MKIQTGIHNPAVKIVSKQPHISLTRCRICSVFVPHDLQYRDFWSTAIVRLRCTPSNSLLDTFLNVVQSTGDK